MDTEWSPSIRGTFAFASYLVEYRNRQNDTEAKGSEDRNSTCVLAPMRFREDFHRDADCAIHAEQDKCESSTVHSPWALLGSRKWMSEESNGQVSEHAQANMTSN
ncbi:hypothetical protein EI94DRAFT_1704995 [Lactarius quietus]|nr:hypothetical protein EI94DRAFT_1704995 [Lactarius quietus]